ncbi:hypothetical protein EJB05_31262, partial [Eragrostis curvula]
MKNGDGLKLKITTQNYELREVKQDKCPGSKRDCVNATIPRLGYIVNIKTETGNKCLRWKTLLLQILSQRKDNGLILFLRLLKRLPVLRKISFHFLYVLFDGVQLPQGMFCLQQFLQKSRKREFSSALAFCSSSSSYSLLSSSEPEICSRRA